MNFKVAFLCVWPVISGWQLSPNAVMMNSEVHFHTFHLIHPQRYLWALRIAASGHQEKTSPPRDIMSLIPINGKGSINDNNLGKSHLLLLISCLSAKLCFILTGSSGSAFESAPPLYQHCHGHSFQPHSLFLGPLSGLPTQSPTLPPLTSAHAPLCCLRDLLEHPASPQGPAIPSCPLCGSHSY